MAIWVRTLKEPVRGQSEGIAAAAEHPAPFRAAGAELIAVLPPLTLLSLARAGAGARGLAINLAAAVVVAAVGWLLVVLTGTPLQWIALGVGVYAAFSWAQGLALRDPPAFAMIFRCRTVLLAAVGFSLIAFVGYGLGFWVPPFFQRMHGVGPAEAGTVLGLSAAIGGWLGVTLGGVSSDVLKRRTQRARLYVGLVTAATTVPSALGLLLSEELYAAYAWNFVFAVTSAMWVGAAASTITDLVLPRMRAIASAFYIMMVTFLGLALGPYTMGQLSDSLAKAGSPAAEALQRGMMQGLAPLAIAAVCLVFALGTIARDEDTRLERARAAGEAVDG
jgi:hypothetical protein